MQPFHCKMCLLSSVPFLYLITKLRGETKWVLMLWKFCFYAFLEPLRHQIFNGPFFFFKEESLMHQTLSHSNHLRSCIPSNAATLKVHSRQTTRCPNNVFDWAISHRSDLGSFYQVMNTFKRLQWLLYCQPPFQILQLSLPQPSSQ